MQSGARVRREQRALLPSRRRHATGCALAAFAQRVEHRSALVILVCVHLSRLLLWPPASCSSAPLAEQLARREARVVGQEVEPELRYHQRRRREQRRCADAVEPVELGVARAHSGDKQETRARGAQRPEAEHEAGRVDRAPELVAHHEAGAHIRRAEQQRADEERGAVLLVRHVHEHVDQRERSQKATDDLTQNSVRNGCDATRLEIKMCNHYIAKTQLLVSESSLMPAEINK